MIRRLVVAARRLDIGGNYRLADTLDEILERYPEPGKIALPPDHWRAFHSISKHPDLPDEAATIQSIKDRGLRLDMAGGQVYDESPAIWATTGDPWFASAPQAELALPRDLLDRSVNPGGRDPEGYDDYFSKPRNVVTLTEDVPAENVLAVHEPWQDALRYILENEGSLDAIEADVQWFLKDPEYGPAVRVLMELGLIRG